MSEDFAAEWTRRVEAHREYLRDGYVDNECDSDQYGETQPAACLRIVADLAARVEMRTVTVADGTPFDSDALMGLVATWAAAWDGSRYGGADEAVPLYRAYFDVLWVEREHPYYGDDIDALAETLEDDAEVTPLGADAMRVVLRHVADQMIADLVGPHADVLAHYVSGDDPRDFVWVEEGISAALTTHVTGVPFSEADHRTACGHVFEWMRETHGVEPPAWYTRGA